MSAFITDYINDPWIEKEVLGNSLVIKPDDNVSVLLVWHEQINLKYMDKFPQLRGLVRYGVGFDNLDLKEASRRGIVSCNTPDYGTDEVSDTAIAMIMALTRGIVRYDCLSKNYLDHSWQSNTLTHQVRSRHMTLGVFGAGRIGSSVLLKSRAIGFQCKFYDPYVPRGYEKVLAAGRVDSLSQLLAESDVVSIHVPLSAQTRGVVNEEFIHEMKDGAYLVNTARGELVGDLDDLVEPLKSGKLSGVGLDVLPQEPPDENQTELVRAWRSGEDWTRGRLLINPHTAYYSQQAYHEMRFKAASNAKRILDGLEPYNILRG